MDAAWTSASVKEVEGEVEGEALPVAVVVEATGVLSAPSFFLAPRTPISSVTKILVRQHVIVRVVPIVLLVFSVQHQALKYSPTCTQAYVLCISGSSRANHVEDIVEGIATTAPCPATDWGQGTQRATGWG